MELIEAQRGFDRESRKSGGQAGKQAASVVIAMLSVQSSVPSRKPCRNPSSRTHLDTLLRHERIQGQQAILKPSETNPGQIRFSAGCL